MGFGSVKGAQASTELVLDDSQDPSETLDESEFNGSIEAMEESDDSSSEVASRDSLASICTSEILNRENWINSFKSKAAHLPSLPTHRGQLENCINVQPKQIWEGPIWKMYGTFECQSCLR